MKQATIALLVLISTPAIEAEAQSTITVDTTADAVFRNGACSLREAIIASNTNQNGDTLSEECRGSGVNDLIRFRAGANPVINLGSALPVITEQVTITGPAARVVINGPGSGVGIDISATAPDTVVIRLVLQDFATGIRVQGANAVIEGNYIGTDAAGNAAVPNGDGLNISASGVRIGGTTGITPGGACTGDCNLISGNNGFYGVYLGTGASATIQGNHIGTNATGTSALGNARGIQLDGNATAMIGGTTPAAGNLISGNTFGIYVAISADAAGSSVIGNRIGTNAAGTGGVPSGYGIIMDLNGKNYPVVIGGVDAGSGNVISGHTVHGITMANAKNVVVRRNRIGTLADGIAPLGNGGTGVVLNSGGFGSISNIIGGGLAEDANVIAWNASGVFVAAGSHHNTIWGNSIHDNVGMGIDLANSQAGTVTTPSITALNPVTGLGCPGCRIDVYSDGSDEGRTHHGAAFANSAGNFLFEGAVDGPYVTATATSVGGSTSEFSAPFFEDSDGDALADLDDNCTLVVNVSQLDVDQDGYGNLCDADLNNSNLVTSVDFNELRTVLNQTCPTPANTSACRADMNGSELVNVLDYNLLRARLNQPPGPSGLACAGTPPCP